MPPKPAISTDSIEPLTDDRLSAALDRMRGTAKPDESVSAEKKPALQRSPANRNLDVAPPLPPGSVISTDSDESPPTFDRLRQSDEPVTAEEKPVSQRRDTTRDLGAPPPPSPLKPVISTDSNEPVQEPTSAGNSVEDAQEKVQQHAEKIMMMSIQSDMQKMERETRAKIIKDEIEARGETAA